MLLKFGVRTVFVKLPTCLQGCNTQYDGGGWSVIAVRGNSDRVGSDQNDPAVSDADAKTLSGRVGDQGKPKNHRIP